MKIFCCNKAKSKQDDDGMLTVSELSLALTQLGDSLSKCELKQMLRQAK